MSFDTVKNSASGRSRFKVAALLLALALLLSLVLYILGSKTEFEKTAQKAGETAKSLGLNSGEAEEAIALAVKTISLSQGEGGFELWRLKAEWANLRRNNDVIVVEEPKLTYNMREQGKLLFVESRTGDVDQKAQILRFIDNVRVTQENKRLTGDMLVYNGKDKTMTFPVGCTFKDADMSGSADTLVWHIDRQLIEGNGNITVSFGDAH